MSLVNPQLDKINEVKRDTAAAGVLRETATTSFLRGLEAVASSGAVSSGPVVTVIPDGPRSTHYQCRDEPMALVHKVMFSLAAVAALLAALVFLVLPPIHAYFSSYTDYAYLAVTAGASVVAAVGTMVIFCAVESAVHWVRDNWFAIAAVSALVIGIRFYLP